MFHSQPVYIAGCAFLNETLIHTTSSNPQSRNVSPPPMASDNGANSKVSPTSSSESRSNSPKSQGKNGMNGNGKMDGRVDQKQLAKHTLLATAANQNFQRCHRALENLEHYWAGAKYILTVLDQKAKGVGEPVLYTKEEMDSALERPSREPAFTSPGWRRKTSWESYFIDAQIGPPAWGAGSGPQQLLPNMVGNSPKLLNVDPNNGKPLCSTFKMDEG
jgi:hypothetical protein